MNQLYDDSDFEEIPEVGFCCVNCGAFAETKKKIKHYDNCKPGESAKWAKYYAQKEEEQESKDE